VTDEEVTEEQEPRSKLTILFFIVFALGVIFGLYLFIQPEVSFLSTLFTPSLSSKNNFLTGNVISTEASQLSIELTSYDSIEKQLYNNPTAIIEGSKVIISLEPNNIILEETKVDYVTIDKDETLCDKYKTYYSDDEITEKFSCAEIKEDLTKIVELGIPVYEKGEAIETKTIDEKVEEVNSSIITYEFDASDIKAGDKFQIGEHSIVFTIVASPSNIFNDKTQTEPNNITHIAINVTSQPYDSLVGYWNFDADSVTTSYDFTSNNNDGTYNGNAHSSSVNCTYDDCLQSDGTTDFVDLGDPSALNFTAKNYTVALWFKTTRSLATDSHMVTFGTHGKGITLGTSDQAGDVGFANSSTTNVGDWNYRIGASLNDNKWHHYVVTFNGTGFTPYIDNVKQTPGAYSAGGYTVSAVNYIADGQYASWSGNLDEIMVFNQSLSDAQISDIYTNQSKRFYPTGQASVKFQNGTITSDNKINVSVNNLEKNFDTNSSLRIGYWNLSDGYGNTNESLRLYYHADATANALDSSANSNNGSFIGGMSANRLGQFNNSFGFDGVNDYITLGNLDANPLSVSAWIKRDNVKATAPAGTGRMIMSVNVLGWGLYFGTDGDGADDKLLFGQVGVNQVESTSTIADTTSWHHIGVTLDGTNARFYIDGRLDRTVAFSSTFGSSGGNYTIGSRGAGEYFNGSMDEIIIWNKTISSNEMKELYIKGRTGNVGVIWSYTNYTNITTANTTYTYSIPSNMSHILPDILQTSTNNSNFYTPLLGGTITLTSFFQSDSPANFAPFVFLNNPANGTTTTSGNIYFASNFTDDVGLNDTTLNVWNATALVGSNYTLIKGINNFTNLSFTLPHQGVFTWNYIANDGTLLATNSTNWTIIYDNIPPQFSTINEFPADPSTYAPAQNYQFNITWTEAQSSIDTVGIEFNRTNYSTANGGIVSIGGGVYRFNITDLPARTSYAYYWWANDSAGNGNVTTAQTYTISQATPVITLTIDSFATNRTVLSGIPVSLNASITTGEQQIQLYAIGNILGQAYNSILNTTTFTGSGSKNVTAFYPATTNYSSTSLTRWVDLLSTGGSICGVAVSATRVNGTVVVLGASSWDTSGALTTYTLTGLCRDGLNNTIAFPTFNTLSTGLYEAIINTGVGGTCQIYASGQSCSVASTSWLSYFGNQTSSSSASTCLVNATSLLSKSSTRPYGQLCRRSEFR